MPYRETRFTGSPGSDEWTTPPMGRFGSGDAGWRADRRSREAGPGLAGITLIVIGALFLIRPLLGIDLMHFAWPLFVLVPGVFLLSAALTGGPRASGLAVPGAIVTMTGAILLVQNSFDLWRTWAYAWALIAPTSVGLGLWLRGMLNGNPGAQRAGRRLAALGAFLFLAFGAFFELLFHPGILTGSVVGVFLAAVLIVAGLGMIARQTNRV